MKVNIIKDQNGNVVATYENGSAGAQLKPVLKPGHSVLEVEAQNNYKDDIKGFYRHHSRR